MKTKSLLPRVNCSLGALFAVALFGLQARPAAFDVTQASSPADEEGTIQPAEALDVETTGAAIDTSSWDELSKQVLPKVMETNLDFGTLLRFSRKASCTVYMVVKTPQITMPELGGFTVPQGPPSTAQISLSWEDANDDGTIADDEIKTETLNTSDIAMRMAMDGVHKGLKSLITLSVVNLLTHSTVKAEKKDEGYEITLNPKGGPPVPMRLAVSRDFRITRTRTPAMDGSELVTNLKHARTGSRWLVIGAEATSGAAEAFTRTDKSDSEYEMRDGIPFLRKVTIATTSSSTGGGVVQRRQEYSFRDWQIEKRAEPLTVVVEPTEAPETRTEPPTTRETPTVTPRTVVRPVEKAEAPKVRILRTEQASTLAKDTILSVGNAYYDIAAAGVKAYDASFTVELDGETVGSFKLKWEAFGGVSVEPDLADDEAKGAVEAVSQQIARVVSGGPLSDYSFAADVYATKSAKQTVIDAMAYAAATDPNVKSNLVYVSPDLRQVRTIRTMGSGETSEMAYAGEEFDAKLFVRSATQTIKKPGGAPEETEYVWTYTKREGLPFVKRLEWSGTVGEETGDWIVALDSVTFEREVARVRIDTGPAGRAKLAREANVPHTEEANKLAQQVLESAETKFYQLTSTDVTAFDATYGMQMDGKSIGTLKVTCTLGGELTVTASLERLPGKPTKEQVEAIKNTAELHGRAVLTALLDVGAAAPGPGAYTMKSGNEYVIDFAEQAHKGGVDAEVAVAYIPEDLTDYREIFVTKNGTILEHSFHLELREGKFVVTSFTWTMLFPGSEPHKNDFTLAHVRKDGELFISRFETEESMGDRKVPWTGVLKDVTLNKQALAAGEAEGDEWGPVPSPDELIKLAEQAKVPRTQETKELAEKVIASVQEGSYSFVDLAAVGFEARLNVSFMGRPLGIASLKWDAVSDLSVEIIEQKDTRAAAQNLLKLIPADMGREIVRIFARPPAMDYYADCYAVQEGDQFTVDATELASKFDPDIKTKLLFVSADLRQLRTALIEKSGRMTLRVDNREKMERKELITSSAVWVVTPGRDPISLEYRWTYGQEAGATFIKTVRHRREVSGRKVTFAATLDNVKLERLDSPEQPTVTEPRAAAGLPPVEEARKLAQETKVPRTEEARQLASQVLASVQKKYRSVFHSTSASEFEVTASVKKDDYDVGNIKIAWKRDDPENVDPKPEKKVEDPVEIIIQGMATELTAIDALMPFVLGPLTSAQAPDGYAVKSGGLCIIDLTEVTQSDNLKSRILCVAQDFSRVQEIRSYKDGDVLEWIFNGEAADGAFLISSATQPISGPMGGDYEPTKFSWTYTRKRGGIFIKKVLVDQALMGNVMHWTIQFGDVTFQGGANIPDIPEDIQNAREQALKDLEEQMRRALEQATAGQGKWECLVCGYIYDPKKGDPENDVELGTPFEDLGDAWTCPDCGGDKDDFEKAG